MFKGREAKLNRVIFLVLAAKGQLTAYDIHKQVNNYKVFKRTRYSSVNKRLRILEKTGYVTRVALRKTKAGFEASLFELRVAAYLALIFSRVNLDSVLSQVSDEDGLSIIAEFVSLVLRENVRDP